MYLVRNETNTCRELIEPKLRLAGWETNPHSMTEQYRITKGRIVIAGQSAKRRESLRADYLLRYANDYNIAVVEAKAEGETAATGLEQAKRYATVLGLKFAYATNGHEIIEFDFLAGTEKSIQEFPTPAELWNRLQADCPLGEHQQQQLLAPTYSSGAHEDRYYQQIAMNRTVEAILRGQKRLLLVMATGTGKTPTAFQICWKLWNSKWNARSDPTRKPRILYLADRSVLVDDPKDKTFAPFGDARFKIERRQANKSRELYFATYQAIADEEGRPGLYREFAPDFFDLVIVDECHRGSAKEDGVWRDILEYFEPAFQLGLTATPKRDTEIDTSSYFGAPIYTYSLRQGIEDGFLAPYRVHRVVTIYDAIGYRPTKGELDRYGNQIPDGEYGTKDFERTVALQARTEAIAEHLTNFMKKTDRFAKTIIFCVNQEHAAEMRKALVNLNSDLVKSHPNYVCRVTADEGDVGKGHLADFQDIESVDPVILTTSHLLTTGVDAQTVKNVVLARVVGSMVEFKQIIGRGTRVREDYNKLYFNIIDYTGTATTLFADPAFDGEPLDVTVDTGKKIVRERRDGYGESDDQAVEDKESDNRIKRFYIDGGLVQIVAHVVHELDADGKQLRVIEYADYTKEKVRMLYPTADALLADWTDLKSDQALSNPSRNEALISTNLHNPQGNLILIRLISCVISRTAPLCEPGGSVP